MSERDLFFVKTVIALPRLSALCFCWRLSVLWLRIKHAEEDPIFAVLSWKRGKVDMRIDNAVFPALVGVNLANLQPDCFFFPGLIGVFTLRDAEFFEYGHDCSFLGSVDVVVNRWLRASNGPQL